MLVKLFFSNSNRYTIATIWISICGAKYVLKHFEVVSFHLIYPIWSLTLLDRKEWKRSKVLCIIESCILQTRTESLKSRIVLGVWWSLKLVLQTDMKKIALLRAYMVVTYYIKIFRTEAIRQNGILLSLFLLVAETIITSC